MDKWWQVLVASEHAEAGHQAVKGISLPHYLRNRADGIAFSAMGEEDRRDKTVLALVAALVPFRFVGGEKE